MSGFGAHWRKSSSLLTKEHLQIIFLKSKLCYIQLIVCIAIRSKEIPAFHGTYNLLACSKETATGAYLETAESRQTSPSIFPNNRANIIFPLNSTLLNPCSWNNVINLSTKLSLWTAPHFGLGSNHRLLTVGSWFRRQDSSCGIYGGQWHRDTILS